MLCDNCGSLDARELRVNRTYGENEDLLVIEGVPVVRCARCGESYMTAATLAEIERLRARRNRLQESRSVGVIKFDAA